MHINHELVIVFAKRTGELCAVQNRVELPEILAFYKFLIAQPSQKIPPGRHNQNLPFFRMRRGEPVIPAQAEPLHNAGRVTVIFQSKLVFRHCTADVQVNPRVGKMQLAQVIRRYAVLDKREFSAHQPVFSHNRKAVGIGCTAHIVRAYAHLCAREREHMRECARLNYPPERRHPAVICGFFFDNICAIHLRVLLAYILKEMIAVVPRIGFPLADQPQIAVPRQSARKNPAKARKNVPNQIAKIYKSARCLFHKSQPPAVKSQVRRRLPVDKALDIDQNSGFPAEKRR